MMKLRHFTILLDFVGSNTSMLESRGCIFRKHRLPLAVFRLLDRVKRPKSKSAVTFQCVDRTLLYMYTSRVPAH